MAVVLQLDQWFNHVIMPPEWSEILRKILYSLKKAYFQVRLISKIHD